MPTIKFDKYHGAGNDFVMLDMTELPLELDIATVERLCNRRFGIGADGLIAICKSDKSDFRMRYYNSDGREASFCGNGSRCSVAFAYDKNIISGTETIFEAFDGIHHANIIDDKGDTKTVRMQMSDAKAEMHDDHIFVDTGSPHYVKIVKALESVDVKTEGAKIRYDKSISPNGTNVDFIHYDDSTIYIRTYERGVEDETLACGTGITAAAIATALWHGGERFKVKARGGDLEVNLKHNNLIFNNITLTGPACRVFSGNIKI